MVNTGFLFQAAAFTASVAAVNNGLARTPQMGWNNWNSLFCDVSESLLLDTAKILVDSGLKDVGYEYVLLDDCWSDGRDAAGYLIADRQKFPNGMGAVSEKLHALDLLFGMYSSAGEMTCARYEGSLDHETADAESFAAWSVDYLKYDNCYHMGRMGTPQISFNRFKAMADALNATKAQRPILYGLCNWGEDFSHTWASSISNSWRMSGDIYDSFTRPDALCSCDDPANPFCVAPGTHCSVLNIINKVAPYIDRGAPGGWNDMDMLAVGLGGMTDEEYKAHFSMWAALKSPLILGNDLRDMTPQTLSLISNPAIIAISQDPLGRSAQRVARNLTVPKDQYGMGETQVWSGPLANGDQVVILFNAADSDLTITAPLTEVFVMDGPGGSAPQVTQSWEIYDLWGGRMVDADAQAVLDKGRSPVKLFGTYNATEVSYRQGLEQADARLFGQRLGSVQERQITMDVPRHGARVLRLRPGEAGAKRKFTFKEEL